MVSGEGSTWRNFISLYRSHSIVMTKILKMLYFGNQSLEKDLMLGITGGIRGGGKGSPVCGGWMTSKV